jgi:hypothetical protein
VGKFSPETILRMRELDLVSREEARAMLGLLASETGSEPVLESISVPQPIVLSPPTVKPEDAPKEPKTRIVLERTTAGSQEPSMTSEAAWVIYQAVCRNEMIEASMAETAVRIIQSLSGEELQRLAKGQVPAQSAPVPPEDLKGEVTQAGKDAAQVAFLNELYADDDLEDSEIPF